MDTNIPILYNISLVDVNRFKVFGTFANNFDDYGNNQLVYSISQSVSGSMNYTKIPLKTFVYNDDKILDSNQTEFTELETVEKQDTRDITEVLNEYNLLLEQNKILNNNINDLVDRYENNDDKQVIQAQKQTIVNLRIQLGQGKNPSDFGDDFPFLPLT